MATTNRDAVQSCPSCTTEIPLGSRFCSSCGTPLAPSTATPTQTSIPETGGSAPASRPSGDRDEGRFVPGDTVAGRYRVVGLIGKGGMGEVFRADDMKLGQPVALKFLPEALERDERRLARLLNEVKLARQVSHPNVCRVYDIGEVDGQHYLSMEFVDGEDLASLMRRIGRLEHEKAIQIARQVCAGLATIHARGMIHRDLKPSNVMIDGRGHARITDFGLAGLALEISGEEIRAGTPEYMSPEQLAGKEVSVRSDIYALGLVLYELFTGRQTFRAQTLVELERLQASATPASPSSVVASIDPGVERVILRCLAKDPAERPSSALAVAAGLPGGDPLAAALEAGETPSPEMVAAAGPEGGLRPAMALAGIAGFIVALLAFAFIGERLTLYGSVPMDKPIAALEDNAREIANRLGYEASPVDRVAYFRADYRELRRIARDADEGPAAWERLQDPSQQALSFTYRQAEQHLAPANFAGVVTSRDPPPQPGDLYMRLDLRGRLAYLRATAPWVDHATDPAPATEWGELFRAAGLDITGFEPTRPTVQPPIFVEARRAWSGTRGATDSPIRVEAGSVRGAPVFFEIITPHDRFWSADTDQAQATTRPLGPLVVILILILALVLGGAVVLAVFNLRRGRGDRRGALRVGLYVFSLKMLYWLATGHHVADAEGQFLMTITALGQAMFLGAMTWLLYLALEPYVRRLWPEVLVSWSRLLAGRVRDPLVGRDLLIGLGFGIAMQYLSYASHQFPALFGISLPPQPWAIDALAGGRWALGGSFSVLLVSLAQPLGLTLLVLLLRIIFRKQWIAAAVFCLTFSVVSVAEIAAFAGQSITAGVVLAGLALGVVTGLFLIVLILRFGLLATVGAFFVASVFAYYPITLDSGAPYFPASMFGLLLCIALAGYAFYISLGGRSLFEELVPEPT